MKIMRIKDFCDYYITDTGDVYSSKRGKLRKLKPENNKKDYLRVTLCDEEGNKHRHYIHRLVALHFLTPDPNKSTVNHKDGNTLNNHVANLEWLTHRENMLHAIKTGLWCPKEASRRSHLNRNRSI